MRHAWLGASVAGLPEDLAARHVQTICTRLRPLLTEDRPAQAATGQDHEPVPAGTAPC